MKKQLRHGFTTGSCAAAAAKAAAYMLLTGKEKENITIETPKGILYTATLEDIQRTKDAVSCAVTKDGGDDPDVTTGYRIYARVSVREVDEAGEQLTVVIDGGRGVGRVTRKGLDQPVGNAAINHVPREMITKEVTGICRMVDFYGTLAVEIYVPDGETLALKTFNPRLGIVGGISILGTTGIVEPMSEAALLDTIRIELRQHRLGGEERVVVSPGNYGVDYMKQTYGFDLDQSVKCSNFIGAAIDMAVDLGFSQLLLVGHVGKLIKLSGGIMNTHSKEGDCRMELLAAAAVRAGADIQTVTQLLECVVTDEALRILLETPYFQKTMQEVMNKIMYYLHKRSDGQLQVECLMYSNAFGELAASGKARQLLQELRQEGESHSL